MSKPTITVAGGLYKLRWDDEKLECKVSRLIDKSDRTVGEVTWTTTRDGIAPHLYQCSFNFTGSRSRSDLAKLMAERYPPETTGADWDAIIEQLSVLVINAMREGEPVQELWTSTDAKPIQYLVDPIFPKDQPTIIFGSRGGGKSAMELLIAVSLSLPWTDNPLGFTVPDTATPGLILDWESEGYLMQRRLKRLHAGMEIGCDFPLQYRRCSGPVADDMDSLFQIIDAGGYKYVIIDSLGPACGGDLNAAGPAMRFFESLRRLHISVLIIAHQAKNGEGEKSVFGSGFFENLSRSVWELKSEQDQETGDLKLGLFQTKASESRRHAPMGFCMHFQDPEGPVTVEQDESALTEGAMADRMPASVLIKAQLSRGQKLTPTELTEAIGRNENTVKTALRRMHDKGVIMSTGDGRWCLRGRRENE
ncbi:MAG: AAA family ATPase [Patescibacteria group bacterium]